MCSVLRPERPRAVLGRGDVVAVQAETGPSCTGHGPSAAAAPGAYKITRFCAEVAPNQPPFLGCSEHVASANELVLVHPPKDLNSLRWEFALLKRLW